MATLASGPSSHDAILLLAERRLACGRPARPTSAASGAARGAAMNNRV